MYGISFFPENYNDLTFFAGFHIIYGICHFQICRGFHIIYGIRILELYFCEPVLFC